MLLTVFPFHAFQEALVRKLVGFAESNVQPLSSYASGLLAGCMEVQDIAVNFKEANARLVGINIKLRL